MNILFLKNIIINICYGINKNGLKCENKIKNNNNKYYTWNCMIIYGYLNFNDQINFLEQIKNFILYLKILYKILTLRFYSKISHKR